jgi:hypothetical protein
MRMAHSRGTKTPRGKRQLQYWNRVGPRGEWQSELEVKPLPDDRNMDVSEIKGCVKKGFHSPPTPCVRRFVRRASWRAPPAYA